MSHRVLLLLIAIIATIAISPAAYACSDSETVEVDGYYWVSVCSDLYGCTGHWQFGIIGYSSTCGFGSGGDGGGGGGGGYSTPSAIDNLRSDYTANGCSPVPDASQFLDESAYNQTGMQNYFSFSDWTDGGSQYVLVDSPLPSMIASMYSCMGNTLPPLGDPGNGAGYRIPGAHTATDACSSHTQGESVDFSTANGSGGHSCQLWNQLAACAHSAGLYVEPWSLIQQQGVIHMHVTTHNPANDPSAYGDACAQP